MIPAGHHPGPIDQQWTDTLVAELRSVAARQLRRAKASPTLQATALVNEAFLRLGSDATVKTVGRAHLRAMAARQIRFALVAHARRRRSRKRGGRWQRLTLTFDLSTDEQESVDLIDLDAVLAELAIANPIWARVIELRFFGGLEEKEAALVLDVTERTVRRQWVAARAWLRRALHSREES